MEKFIEIWLLILLNGLLASSTPQSYDRRLLHRNSTITRSRRIDDRRQIGTSSNTAGINRSDGCNEVFCENDPNYPKSYIQSLNLDKFENLFGDDFVEMVSVRNGFDDEVGLCASRRRLIHPKRGKTRNGEWLVIVNNDERYRQGILVEECSRQYSRCDYADHFPLGIQAVCKQNFIFRNLVAIGSDGIPTMEYFQFPSCCKCFISVGRSNQPDQNPIRFGGSDEENDQKRKASNEKEKYVLPY